MNEQHNDKLAENPEKCKYVAPELIRISEIATATQAGGGPGSDGGLFS